MGDEKEPAMIRILLAVLVLSSSACSDDDATPDLGTTEDRGIEDQGSPDGYIRCPASKPIDGHACTLPATDPPCDYPIEPCPCGPSDLQWHCSCESGKWKCSRDYDCYPCIDGAVDGSTDSGTTFACGAQAHCKIGEEYCKHTMPGQCGGSPVPDSGVCPPDCSPSSCGGGGQEVCLCQSYSCVALPSGCNSCSCLGGLDGGGGSCSCSEQSGANHYSCAMP